MTDKQKEVQTFLSKAFKVDKQIDLDTAKLESMRDALHGKAMNYENDGSQHNPNGNSVENAILKVIEYNEKINAEIDELIDLKLEIEKIVNKVTDDIQREILTRKYLLFQTWDGYYDKKAEQYVKGIYDEMHYSRRRIFQLHLNALDCIELH